jgi:chemotaxis protein histidine kinase CheA
MPADAFADRLAKVRHRFVSTLESKIEDAYAALPKLPAMQSDSAAAAAQTYRCVHGIVGVGPTVGFPSTARAAREVEEVLRSPQHNNRGLTVDEILLFKKRLHALREVATRELQSFYAR